MTERWKIDNEYSQNEYKQTGTLYGIGVGPGDPELMTIKAVRILRSCQVIFTPGKTREDSTAYTIAVQAVPELSEKECVCVDIPMIHDRTRLSQVYDQIGEMVKVRLLQGENVGFLNLGDVTFYATYLHVHRRILKEGLKAELINGIPSFCAAAGALGKGLVEGHEQFHILSKPGQVEKGLLLSGTKVIMKSGRQSEHFKECLKEAEKDGQEIFLVENCGMPGQRLEYGAETVTGNEGYYSLIIVKDRREEK